MKIRINDVEFHRSFWVDEKNIAKIDSRNESETAVRELIHLGLSPHMYGKNKWYGHKIMFEKPIDGEWYGLLVSKRTYERIIEKKKSR